MSFDLVFWKGTPRDPAAAWGALAAGAAIEGIESIALAEAYASFARVAGARDLGAAGFVGGGWEASLAPRGYLHVTCAWALLRSPEGQRTLAQLRAAGCEALGAACFNPQTGGYREAPREVPPTRDPVVLAAQLDDTPEAWLAVAERERADDPDRAALIERTALWAAERAAGAGDPASTARVAGEIATLEAMHRARWTPAWSSAAADVTCALDRGYVRALTITLQPTHATAWPRVLRRILAHPATTFLRTLELSACAEPDETCEAMVQELAQAPHLASLRHLTIDRIDRDDYPWLATGDLGRILARAPRLTSLTCSAATLHLRPTAHAHLADLQLRSRTVDVEDVARCQLPALAKLGLWVGPASARRALDPAVLARIVSPACAPALAHLRLAGVANVAAVIAAIAHAPLRSLALDEVDDAAARALLAWPAGPDGELPNLWLRGAVAGDDVLVALAERYGARLELAHPAIRAYRAARGAARRDAERAAAAAPPPAPRAAPGARVTHAKFGGGTIVRLDDDKATIAFDDGAERKLLLRFVTLDGR